MFRSLKVSVLLVFLAALALAALPVLPRTETASLELRPEETTDTRTLLGENLEENSSNLRQRPEGSREIGGSGGTAGTMTLTIPRLDVEDLPVPNASSQVELDREGIIHLQETGYPWEEGSNTFVVGHALGFLQTKVPYVFYELDQMKPGDEIFVEDQRGERYTFRVYDRMTVRPADYWVTYPVAGKTVISLQSCTPIPTFEHRLVIRGELVG